MLASISDNPLTPFLPHALRRQTPKSSHFDPWRSKKPPNSRSKNLKIVMKNASAARLPQKTLSKLDFSKKLTIWGLQNPPQIDPKTKPKRNRKTKHLYILFFIRFYLGWGTFFEGFLKPKRVLIPKRHFFRNP